MTGTAHSVREMNKTCQIISEAKTTRIAAELNTARAAIQDEIRFLRDAAEHFEGLGCDGWMGNCSNRIAKLEALLSR